jgi:hypothetical protein
MTGIQIFFIGYFAIMAACLVHRFVFRKDVGVEFLGKLIGGLVGASVATLLFADRITSVQGTWYVPMAGAFVAALLTAVVWKVLVTGERERAVSVEVSPVAR